ncbi:septum formation inhibitor [Escherichia coli O121:H19 str. 2010C-3840]|uniref:septum site-determining protein MinC n=6 Tax=Enterobacteriaceae TaxID=543 RepID=UPI00044A61C4|nr:septum site-determining protein MinC [Escherichia coli]EYV03780.1 septum formation inhibitor [Escherichia coli O121:H19 str. 2010C-3840]
MSNTPIELKGSSFTLSVVHLHEAEPKVIHQALEDKIAQAPAFLKHAPVVLNVSALEDPVNWSAMHKAVSATGLRVIGVSGCKDAQLKAEIEKMGLPILTEGKEKAPRPAPAPQAPAQNTTPVTKTRLIDTPVRSGQRIYAPQCDLIVTSHVSAGAELIADGNIHVYGMMRVVTSHVSAGAELIADGNIHVYGMMRGRALAGASGDRETQIFCTNLMAELVSIAGEYWLSDQIPAEFYGKAARLQLVENALTVQPLN